jgi:outer membrane protein
MNRMRLYGTCLFIISLLIVPSSAFAFFAMDASVGYWQQEPSGTMSYKATGANDQLDLANDLKYGDKSRPFVRVRMELPLILPNVYFMATPMSFEGTGSKNVNFKFGDNTFNANVPIDSKLKLDHYDLALFYPIPLLKTATAGVLNIDVGLNARKIDFEGTINQSPNISQSKSVSNYLPMLFAAVQLMPMNLFAIEVEFRGVAQGQNHYYDYIGRLKIKPIPIVYVSGGYRSEDIKIDDSDVKAAMKFKGPFVEAGVNF